jgi:plastocyanin
MSRVFAGLLIVLVVVLSLAPGLPTATPTLADGMDGSGGMPPYGTMGPMGGMMAGHQGMMGGSRRGGGGPTPGCGRGQQNVPARAIAELPDVTINIYDGFFLPDDVTVPAGTRVMWVNKGDRPHSATAWNLWDSGVLRPGESCQAWFVTPGSYSYLSIVAADGGTMTGTVTVQGSLPEESGPSEPQGPMRRMPGMPGTGY